MRLKDILCKFFKRQMQETYEQGFTDGLSKGVTIGKAANVMGVIVGGMKYPVELQNRRN